MRYVAKRGVFLNGFDARVECIFSETFVFGPSGQETPTEQLDAARIRLCNDGRLWMLESVVHAGFVGFFLRKIGFKTDFQLLCRFGLFGMEAHQTLIVMISLRLVV